jgi:hypothetical protein
VKALAMEVSLAKCKECIREYQFAIQAFNISVATANQESAANTLSDVAHESLDDDKEELVWLEDELSHYREAILPYVKKQYAEKKKVFEALWKAREKKDYQVRNHIDNNIFAKHKMRTQAYHGGSKYTGEHIGILMEYAEEIMGKTDEYLITIDHEHREASDEEISHFCGLIKSALDMLDIMFSILRKKHGEVEEDDYAQYEKAAEEAVKIWDALDMNYTPSFHYAHKEALRLLKHHKGFAELTEDHIEQSHQTMNSIHQRLGRLGFGPKRAMAISRLEKMSNDPELRQKIAEVKAARKRKFKNISKGVRTKIAMKKVKRERRSGNLEKEMAKAEK